MGILGGPYHLDRRVREKGGEREGNDLMLGLRGKDDLDDLDDLGGGKWGFFGG